MSTENIVKVTHEKWPHELEHRVRELNKYPKSGRVANELYKTSVDLLKENGIWRCGPYKTELRYTTSDDSTNVTLQFERRYPYRTDGIYLALPLVYD